VSQNLFGDPGNKTPESIRICARGRMIHLCPGRVRFRLSIWGMGACLYGGWEPSHRLTLKS
jgi:hypothetical protein